MKKHKQRFEHEVHVAKKTHIQEMIECAQHGGWELVDVIPESPEGNKKWYTLFFKRPV